MVAQRQPPAVSLEPSALVYDDPQPIRLPLDWELTDERFLQIGELNPEQIFERTADGKLQQVTWPELLSSTVAARIRRFVGVWVLATAGEEFGGDRGYFLPGGPARAPDVSWVSPQQLAEHGPLRGQFQLAPRFVVEVISSTQTRRAQQSKMDEWMSNGVQLGWLIDPYEEIVWIYRADDSVEQLDRPEELSGENVCVGLSIDMTRVWEAD